MLKKVLVPLDGSNESASVLPYVRGLASKFNTNAYILGIGIGSKRRRVNRLLEEYIGDVTKNLSGENIKAEPVVLYGRPADEILVYTEENDISLIIMATHGRGGVTRWWMGSVAEKVISEAPTPILLVQSKRIEESEDAEKLIFRKILVPLDGSDVGEAALPYAEELAIKNGASLNLVHIITPPGGVESRLFGTEFRRLVKAMHTSGGEYLSDIAERLGKNGISTTCTVMDGDPANVIVEYAIEEKVDLVAMSTHGRSGIARWVLGSVADKVLHGASMPMWLVRSPKMVAPGYRNRM